MAEKLSWTELRRVLAARAGVSEKKAGAFLNAFQGQLVEALRNDKQVKINGLGTFKVQAVASRKSVNVATGEDFVIEGYNKLSFTPEAGVRELIEKRHASPLPTPEGKEEKAEIDPLKKLGAQAEEIVDLLGDLGQKPGEVPSDEVPSDEVPSDKGPSDKGPSDKVPSDKVPSDEVPSDEVPSDKVPSDKVPSDKVRRTKEEKKESHFVRDTLICVVILLLLLLVGYFFLRQQLSSIIDSFVKPNQTEVVAERVVVEPLTEETERNEASVSEEQKIAEETKAYEDALGRYPNLITTEPMHEASRLAWMSKRYYGAKVYWPYLYDANRDVIINPCLIRVGTPIRVPKLSKQQLDTTNAQTAAYLEKLRIEAEAACGR